MVNSPDRAQGKGQQGRDKARADGQQPDKASSRAGIRMAAGTSSAAAIATPASTRGGYIGGQFGRWNPQG